MQLALFELDPEATVEPDHMPFPFQVFCSGCDSLLGRVTSPKHGAELLDRVIPHIVVCAKDEEHRIYRKPIQEGATS